MMASASFPLAACFILLHLSLVPTCQAAVSECLTCMAIGGLGGQESSAAEACRTGSANVPKLACKAPKNHGCGVEVKKVGSLTTFPRKCCSDVANDPDRCQVDLHQKYSGRELDAERRVLKTFKNISE